MLDPQGLGLHQISGTTWVESALGLVLCVQPLLCVLQGTDAGSEWLPQRALARGRGVPGPSFRALFLRSNSPTSPAPVDLQTAPVYAGEGDSDGAVVLTMMATSALS